MRKETVKLEVLDKEVEISAPTVMVLEKAAAKGTNEMTQVISMIASCANMSEGEIRALDLKDFMALKKVLEGFLEDAGIK